MINGSQVFFNDLQLEEKVPFVHQGIFIPLSASRIWQNMFDKSKMLTFAFTCIKITLRLKDLWWPYWHLTTSMIYRRDPRKYFVPDGLDMNNSVYHNLNLQFRVIPEGSFWRTYLRKWLYWTVLYFKDWWTFVRVTIKHVGEWILLDASVGIRIKVGRQILAITVGPENFENTRSVFLIFQLNELIWVV